MAEYATIKDLQSLRDTVDRRIGKLETKQEEHHKTLFGNGVPGWDEMLRTLYADYLERKETEREQRKAEQSADKQTILERIKSSGNLQVAIINGLFMVLVAIFTYYLHAP